MGTAGIDWCISVQSTSESTKKWSELKETVSFTSVVRFLIL